MIQLLGTIELYATTLTLFAFILYYHVKARWRKYPEGRWVMSWSVATFLIFLFLSTAVAGALSPTVRAWIRFVIYGAFLYLAAHQFVLVRRAQRHKDLAPVDVPKEPAP